jgi:hypothetical protein
MPLLLVQEKKSSLYEIPLIMRALKKVNRMQAMQYMQNLALFSQTVQTF